MVVCGQIFVTDYLGAGTVELDVWDFLDVVTDAVLHVVSVGLGKALLDQHL